MGNCCTTRDRELIIENNGKDQSTESGKGFKNEVSKSLIYISQYLEQS